jgi:hypothetical protein
MLREIFIRKKEVVKRAVLGEIASRTTACDPIPNLPQIMLKKRMDMSLLLLILLHHKKA